MVIFPEKHIHTKHCYHFYCSDPTNFDVFFQISMDFSNNSAPILPPPLFFFFPPWHSAGGFDALERFAGPRLGFQAAASSLRSCEGTALWDGGYGVARAVSQRLGMFWQGDFFFGKIDSCRILFSWECFTIHFLGDLYRRTPFFRFFFSESKLANTLVGMGQYL